MKTPENISAIEIKGINRNETIIGSQDGCMHDLVNLRFRDGSWRTSGDGKRVWSFSNLADNIEYTQLYVHTGNKYKHLLGVNGGKLYWFANIDNDGQTFMPVERQELTTITGDMYINQTGHLITVIDGEDNFEYFVFKMNDDPTQQEYKQVKVDENGEQSARNIWPFGRAHFNLYSPMEKDYYFTNFKNGVTGNLPSLGDTRYWQGYGDLHDANLNEDGFRSPKRWQNIMVATWAKATEANKFTNPFLACVACELYDGSWVLASNPVLLWPHDRFADDRRSIDINPGGINLTNKDDRSVLPCLFYEYQNYRTTIIPTSDPLTDRYRYPRAFIPQGMIIPQNLGFYLKENGEIFTPEDYRTAAEVIVKNVPVCIEATNTDDIVLNERTLRRPHLIKGDCVPVMCFGASSFFGYANPTGVGLSEGNAPKCEICGSDLTLSLANTSFLEENSDVFKSIGVFITKPADIYNMEADYDEGRVVGGIDITYRGSDSSAPKLGTIFNIGYIPKERGRDEIQYDLMHSPFYLLRKYTKESISELVSDPRVKLTDKEYEKKLKNITQETNRLEIESSSRMTYLPKVAYSYNNRMHIANYKSYQFHGYPLDMFQLHNHLVSPHAGSYFKGILPNIAASEYGDGYRQYNKQNSYFLSSTTPSVSQLVSKLSDGNRAFAFIKVWLNTENGEQTVTRYIAPYNSRVTPDGSDPNFIEELNPLLTFPDNRAFKMRIMIFHTEVNPNYVCWWDREFDLKPHPLMNMAYYMHTGLTPIPIGSSSEHWNYVKRYSAGDTKVTVAEYLQGLNYNNLPIIPAEKNNIEYYPNYLKVSKVNNPLYFPVETTYGIGQSAILAMMSNTIAVGTGQTGAAPLYVFCQDGVYALFVDASGEMVYTNSRILARDVLSVPRSVTPTDNGVAFITERGLMMIAGEEVQEIGQPCEGEVEDITEPATGTWDVTKKFVFNRATLQKLGNLPTAIFDGVDFLTYLNDKRNSKETLVSYNHNERELIVCNPNYPYAYVINRNFEWSRRDYTADQFVNNFPTTYRVKNGVFYKMDDEGDINTVEAVRVNHSNADNSFFALSDPMKLNSIGFKQAHRFVVRGEFETALVERAVEPITTPNYNPLGTMPIYKTINLPATVDGYEWSEQNIQLIDPIDFTIPANSTLRSLLVIIPTSHYTFNGHITVTLADSDCVFRNSIRNRIVPKMSVRLDITNRDTGITVLTKDYNNLQVSEDNKTVTLDLSADGTLPYGLDIPAGNYRLSMVLEEVSLRQVYTKDEEEIDAFINKELPSFSFGGITPVLENKTSYAIYPDEGSSSDDESDGEEELPITIFGDTFTYHAVDKVQARIKGKHVFTPLINGNEDKAEFSTWGRTPILTYGVYLTKYNAVTGQYSTVRRWPNIPLAASYGSASELIVNFEDNINGATGTINDLLNDNTIGIGRVNWEEGAIYRLEVRLNNYSTFYVNLSSSYTYAADNYITISPAFGSNAEILIANIKTNNPTYQFVIDTVLDNDSSSDDESDDSSADDAGFEIADFHALLQTYTHIEHDPTKLGCYVFGSYDGRKWSLLGGNERTGHFKDIGCEISRTDMKFFRVCLAGQLKGNSRIDYIEMSNQPSILNTKIR